MGAAPGGGAAGAGGVTLRGFELGPIRPPSEAHSLLVRVIRNCTWNRCTFCPVYKGTKASQRDVDEVLGDVDAMAAVAEVLRARGWATVRAGELPQESYQVELFRRAGERTVFLQDADPCAVKPEKLAAVIARVKERFPSVERVMRREACASRRVATASSMARSCRRDHGPPARCPLWVIIDR